MIALGSTRITCLHTPGHTEGTMSYFFDVTDENGRTLRVGTHGGVGMNSMARSVLTLASYFIGHYLEAGRWEIVNSPDGMSMAFLTLSMVEIFHSFNMRSRKGSIFHMKHQNKYLWGAMALSFVLTSAVIYIPALSSAFGFERISALEYDVAIGLGLLVIPAVEISKWIRRKFA